MRGAFPTLFPYSKADFNILQSRIVTLATYAKYMLSIRIVSLAATPYFATMCLIRL